MGLFRNGAKAAAHVFALFKRLAPLGLLLAACASPLPTEAIAETREAIINGTDSTSAQDAAIEIDLLVNGKSLLFCTGVLIAPNLVLTAQHCVRQDGNGQCPDLGAMRDPTTYLFYQGVNAPKAPDPIAKGKRIITPSNNNICSHDVALIELDREVANPVIASLRASALATGEHVTAVGYGADENGNFPTTRKQRDTTVLGVGPAKVPYTTKAGTVLTPYDLPDGDIATGESHCNGDSGGPLFDDNGSVVGIISRGYPSSLIPNGEDFGPNKCNDLPELYSGIQFNADFIAATAKSMGATVDVEDLATTKTATTSSAGTASSKQNGDDDDDDSGSRGHSLSPPAPSSCALGRSSSTNGGAFVMLAIVTTAAVASRRRRRR
jgi:secreted trypsin-like serine protease